MAFLTKKELSLIRLIKASNKLTPTDKKNHINQINYNARLRQDGYRLPVREFIQAMVNHGTNNILKIVQ